MQKAKNFIFFVVFLFISLSCRYRDFNVNVNESSAKAISPHMEVKYDVYLTVEDPSQNNFGHGAERWIGNGWECHAKGSVVYRDATRNYKAELVPQESRATSLLNESDLWRGKPSAHLKVTRNTLYEQPDLGIAFSYVCDKTVVEDQSYYDSDYGWQTRSYTNYLRMHKVWVCPTPSIATLGQDAPANTMQCQPGEDTLDIREMGSIAWNAVQKLKVNADIVPEAAPSQPHNNYYYNNCGDKRKGVYLIRVGQGVGGHVGEDDFVVYVTLDRQKTIEIQTKTGMVSGEILYCPAEDRGFIEAYVSAIEEDVVFSDRYVPEKSRPFQINKTDKDFVKMVNLKRSTWFGEFFTPKTSTIKLEATYQE